MSLYIVDIHGEIEGDYDIVRKYEEPKTGHWIFVEYWHDIGRRIKCSECGRVFCLGDKVSRHYCPNCGAKMEEVEV